MNQEEPDFLDLVKFVDREASVAQSRYADRNRPAERPPNQGSNTKPSDRWNSGSNRMVNYVNHDEGNSASQLRCHNCGGDHHIPQCPKYSSLTVNQRWEIAKQKGWCFSCLAIGHRVKDCRNRNVCGIESCVKRHHPTLHINDKTVPNEEKIVYNNLRENGDEVYLGVIPVRIVGPKRTEVILALLDSGANTTLIRRDVINRMGIRGTDTKIKVNTVLREASINAEKCQFGLEAMDASDNVTVRDAFAIDNLPIKLRAKHISNWSERWPHLKGITADKFTEDRVAMIIGCDQPKAHWVLDTRIGGESQPFGLRTPLGWIVLGPANMGVGKSVFYAETQEIDGERTLDAMISQLYNHEFEDLGSNDGEPSREELDAMSIVTTGTLMNDGHYTVPLPWKVHPPPLGNNKHSAVRRLLGLNRRFRLNPELAGKYNEIIRDHVKKGYAIKVGESDMLDSSTSWYLPHHPVINPKKPGKLRIVFDCAATYQGRWRT